MRITHKMLGALVIVLALAASIFYSKEVTFFKSYIPAQFGSLHTIAICNEGWIMGGWGYAIFSFDKTVAASIEKEKLVYFKGGMKAMRLPQLVGTGSHELLYNAWKKNPDTMEGIPPSMQCRNTVFDHHEDAIFHALDTNDVYVSAAAGSHGALYVIPKLGWVFYSYMDR